MSKKTMCPGCGLVTLTLMRGFGLVCTNPDCNCTDGVDDWPSAIM